MTGYNPYRHRRRSMRLQGYDYGREGAYSVTLVTHERQIVFGNIVERSMILSEAGQVAEQCWQEIPTHFPHVELDEFVVMPNHVHGILLFTENAAAAEGPVVVGAFRSPKKTLGSVVRGFKIGVTNWMRSNTDVYKVWQRNYHDRIIRDERHLNALRGYIYNNPLHWDEDENNPEVIARLAARKADEDNEESKNK